MSLQLEQQLERARKALTDIAAGRFLNARGHSQKLSKDAMVQHARSACVELGWPFDLSKLQRQGGRHE